ncbi:hypothetical protein PG997_001778 [Apiospora hydei]|uniref:Uncharacterized protein n=1 Tax=Apiospora hydei TaxID=1337664 RepID=A0ABR1XEH3_9PEZI
MAQRTRDGSLGGGPANKAYSAGGTGGDFLRGSNKQPQRLSNEEKDGSHLEWPGGPFPPDNAGCVPLQLDAIVGRINPRFPDKMRSFITSLDSTPAMYQLLIRARRTAGTEPAVQRNAWGLEALRAVAAAFGPEANRMMYKRYPSMEFGMPSHDSPGSLFRSSTTKCHPPNRLKKKRKKITNGMSTTSIIMPFEFTPVKTHKPPSVSETQLVCYRTCGEHTRNLARDVKSICPNTATPDAPSGSKERAPSVQSSSGTQPDKRMRGLGTITQLAAASVGLETHVTVSHGRL